MRGLFNPSWIDTTSYVAGGSRSASSNSGDGEISHSESVIDTPTQKLTLYFTYGTSYEQGDTALTDHGYYQYRHYHRTLQERAVRDRQ